MYCMKNLKKHQYFHFEYIVSYIKTLKVRKILDFGCGNCELLSYIDNGIYDLYGYEVDKNIKQKNNLEKTIKLKHGNPNGKLPYKNNMFDVVILSHVLEHVSDERKCIKEIFRVLRPGGYFFLASPYRGIFTWADSANFKYFLPSIHRIMYSLLEGKREYKRQFISKTRKMMYADTTLGVFLHKHYKEKDIRMFLGEYFNIIEFKKYSLFFPFIHLLNYFFQKIRKTDNYPLYFLQRCDSRLLAGEFSYNFIMLANKKI
jgi:SAM-dependent methyltransferase